MAEHKFRTALNGFNREDVVRYIDYMNTVHASEMEQLNNEKQALQEEIAELKEQQNLASRVAELEERCMELEQLNMNATEELETAQEQIAKLQEELEQCAQQRDEAMTKQEAAKNVAAEELEAYRRAERMERSAKERAGQLYRQATGTLAEATTHVDKAAEQFNEIALRVSGQIEELQNAIECSKNALQDAATTMYTIRPVDWEE